MSATDPATPEFLPPAGDPPATPPADDADWEAFIAALRDEGLAPGQVRERLAASRKWEQRAKDNARAARELDDLRRSAMSDTDKAVEEAREAVRAEMRAENATRLASAAITAALTGVVPDPGGIVEDLNLTRYITEDGDVDATAVKALADRYRDLSPGKGTADLKQGARTPPPTPVDTNEWLRRKVTARS